MKFFNFLILIFLFAMRSQAQQNHFIYIQTEDKQPFYVKMADRLLSSSSVGYLVIPRLQDGKYEIGIGFPKNEWPLQKIIVSVKNNDAGYILKNFDSKGWGLFNMQTMDVIMASKNTVATSTDKETTSDGFADVLADVVSTPSIKQKTVNKEVTEEPPVAKTTTIETNNQPVQEEKAVKEKLKPAVKIATNMDSSGRTVVYLDDYENKTDTIRLFIPYKTVAVVSEADKKPLPPVEVKKEEPKQDTKPEIKAADTESKDGAKTDPVSKEPVEAKKETAVKNKETTEPMAENKMVIMTNSDCKTNASADDFLKLRKKMAAEDNDDAMIAVAKKNFKTKCFSTEQVANLGVLFLKDEGRYNFFDAAYPRISDSQNFPNLVNRLTDEYYITRFKAMIRH